jgi:tetratricopeptide (TPR) repeat protein
MAVSAERHAQGGSFAAGAAQMEGALALFPSLPGGDRTLARIFYGAGLADWKRKDRDAAIGHFTKALAKDPAFLDARLGRADLYSFQRQYPQAYDDYAVALAQDPANKRALYNRGYTYLLQDRDTDAVNDLNALIARDPKHFRALAQRSYARNRLKDYTGALDDAVQAVALEPKEWFSHEKRVQALTSLQRYDDALAAVEAWESAVGVVSVDSESHRGYLLEQKGDIKGAMDVYNRAIALDPKNKWAYRHRGYVKWRYLNDISGALLDMEVAVTLGDTRAKDYRTQIMSRQRR